MNTPDTENTENQEPEQYRASLMDIFVMIGIAVFFIKFAYEIYKNL